MTTCRLSIDETLQFPTTIGIPEEVYRDPYTVIRRQTAHFDGFRKEYYMWDRGVRAGIIPVHNGRVLLTRQYRFLVNCITTEVAGGKVEEHESPLAAAVRECAEETGVHCMNPKRLIHYHPGLDTYHNPTTVFYSTELADSVPESGDKFVWLDLGVAIEQIFAGKINDSLSIIGLLSLQNRLSNHA